MKRAKSHRCHLHVYTTLAGNTSAFFQYTAVEASASSVRYCTEKTLAQVYGHTSEANTYA